jgi:hypothetical protein
MSIYLKLNGDVVRGKLLETSWTNESRKCVWKTACHTTDRLETDQGDVLETELSEDDRERLMENTAYPKGYKYFLDEELARRSRDFCGVWVNYFNGKNTETFSPDGERLSLMCEDGDTLEVKEYAGGDLCSINRYLGGRLHGDQLSFYPEDNSIRCLEKYELGDLVDKRVYHANGILQSRENERFSTMYDREGLPTKIVKGDTIYFFEMGVLKDISVFGDKKKDLYKRIKLNIFRGRVQRKIMRYIS